MLAPDLLNGPFMSPLDLTRYDDEPGYDLIPRDVASGYDLGASVLARLDRLAATGKAA